MCVWRLWCEHVMVCGEHVMGVCGEHVMGVCVWSREW